jgi:hypothetical protein
MVCSHRCIPVVVTIDRASYDVDVDAIISLRFVSHGVIFLPLDSLILFDLCKISLRPKFQQVTYLHIYKMENCLDIVGLDL